MPSDLEIQLLGDVRVVHRGEVLPIDSHRLQALLGYLILHRGAPQQRRRIAFQFWPDSTEAQALTNLRQLLHNLRQALPRADTFLRVERGTLTLSEDAPARIDVLELEAAWTLLEEADERGDVAATIDAGERAAALYRGELLPGCYDDWIETERTRLGRKARAGLQRLIGALESRHEHGRAIPYAERLTELDPLSEPSHQLLIRLHALAGDPPAAARAFHAWTATLESELGTEPAPETRALFQRIQRGEVASRAAGPSVAGAGEGRLPLIGRAKEWARLKAAWERAAEGPRFVLIAGEAGIGKTRLAESLVDWVGRQGHAAARARCWAAEGLLPLGPVAQWLRTTPLHQQALSLDTAWRADVARVLPELRAEPPSEDHDEPWRRTRLFDALARVVLSAGQPLLLLLDDLQWCDADTLEWLHFLLRSQPPPRLLLLTTLRSGEPPAEPGLSRWLLHVGERHTTDTIALEPLPPSETGALGAAVARRQLDDDEVADLHRDTEGNPLFIVEMVRARLTKDENTPEHRDTPALPPRIQAVIRGRLERLSSDALDLVGLLATIGRDFSLPLLRAIEGDPDRLARALDELTVAHVIRERDGGYDFTHDKIRDVAYGELGRARRSLLHERAARALIAASEGAAEGVAGEVARHFERAGMGDAAIPWYRRAADRARVVFANREAAAHLERALELLRQQPETRERAERELELQMALGAPLVAVHHYSGPRVWRTYSRARELCERLGRRPDAPVLRALALAILMRSRLADVLELCTDLARVAEENRDPMLQVEAQYVLGVTRYWQGRPGAARACLRRALELYDPERGPDHLRLFSQDPAIVCGIRLALAEWHLGAGAAAHRRCRNVLRRAEALAHPFSLAYARVFGSWLLINCGDLQEARRQIPALLRESEEHGMSVWPAMGGIIEGWLMTRDGRGKAGLERMRRAAAAVAASEVDLGFPYHQALYGEACLRLGEPDLALAAVREGLAMSARTGEAFWDPELLRLQGAALREGDASPTAVDQSFRRALELARAQAARPLERRIRATQNAVGTVHG